MLPIDLKHRAQGLARRMGISLGELIREALEATLSGDSGEVREDAFYADNDVYAGRAPSDLAESHDRHLYGDDG